MATLGLAEGLHLSHKLRSLYLLGPAFVAGVAYLDPGNVATNLTAGGKYGYLLLWVIVAANLSAWLVQYLSAKFGIVSGKSIPQLMGETIKSPTGKFLYWLQAQLVAIATDVAEVIGGAIALHLLFHLPMLIGGLVTGAFSIAHLMIKESGKIKLFELVVMVLIAITAIGFTAGLFVAPMDINEMAKGFIPGFEGKESLLLAVSIFGATIMPHAIYAHSALCRDRNFHRLISHSKRQVIRATRWDVSLAMLLAGLVNIGIFLVGAVNLIVIEIASNPTMALVFSQVVLSLGIPFALFPLIYLTSKQTIMGEFANSARTKVVGYLLAIFLTGLNLTMIALLLA